MLCLVFSTWVVFGWLGAVLLRLRDLSWLLKQSQRLGGPAKLLEGFDSERRPLRGPLGGPERSLGGLGKSTK